MKAAFIFSGQGAQSVGMGKDIFEKSPAGRSVYEKADEVLLILKKYSIIYSEKVEMDDETVTVYKYSWDSASSFASLLIFAHEMIEKPNNFYYYCGGRKKPYLS